MVVTMRTNIKILFEIQRMKKFITAGALRPEVVWHRITLVFLILELWFVEDSHIADVIILFKSVFTS